MPAAARREAILPAFHGWRMQLVHTHQHQRRKRNAESQIHRCEVRCRSIIIETINDQGKRSDNSLVRATKSRFRAL